MDTTQDETAPLCGMPSADLEEFGVGITCVTVGPPPLAIQPDALP